MVCHPCRVASYLEEEAGMEWYGEDTASEIRALALAWHDRCTQPCDCEVKSRVKRGILSRLQVFFRTQRGKHV
jgi:hypothetical protein